MAIYAPNPAITRLEKDLLVLLAKIVLEENRQSYDGNVGSDCLLISDQKAATLCDLLTEYAGSRPFVQGVTFVEMMSDGHSDDDPKAREIYLKARTERGRTRVLASRQWAEFRSRLGLSGYPYGYDVRSMDAIQFVEMEMRLLRSLKVHPALEKLIEDLVIRRSDILEKLERREEILKPGQIRRSVLDLARRLKHSIGGIDISKTQVVGMATIVSDVTVLFTTRDWGVAGTLSTIAGGLAMGVPESES